MCDRQGDDYTITVYDVNDTGRESGFVDQVCKFECSQGCDLRRLKILLISMNTIKWRVEPTFRTMVLPVARAGPIFHATMAYAMYISLVGGMVLQYSKFKDTPRGSSMV